MTAYSFSHYGLMINDRIRTDAYFRALERVVRPGSTVIDIGTGTGILSLIACKLGAGKVYAIEPSDAIELARELARTNGFSDRIEFHQEMSIGLELPEQADVVITAVQGVLPLFRRSLESIIDARKRLLKPDGVILPTLETIWAVVVNAPELYAGCVSPWCEDLYGLDLQAGRRIAVNTWKRGRADVKQLLTDAQQLAALDYRTINTPNIVGTASMKTKKSGIAHGLLVWFDCVLIDDIGFSNAPDKDELVFSSAFFPFEQPVKLNEGSHVDVKLSANLVGDDYVWRWHTEISHPENNNHKTTYKQSTFLADLRPLDKLRRRAATYTPILNEEGQIDSFILSRMNGEISSQDLAAELFARFPGRFSDLTEALSRVGCIAEQFSS